MPTKRAFLREKCPESLPLRSLPSKQMFPMLFRGGTAAALVVQRCA
jgi:hypothetical protein